MISAAILAGGQARRFGGRNKSALVVGATSILDRQLTVLRETTPHILIVGGTPSGEQVAGVRVVPDRIPAAGPLGGIYTALEEAHTDLVLVIACDMPFLTTPFLSRLAALAASTPGIQVVVPRDAQRRHPLCAVYAKSSATILHTRLVAGRLRVLDALEDLRVLEMEPDEVASFDRSGRLLMNVNTPEDFTRALSLH